MDYIFDDWKKILADFQNSVEKDLAEIHQQKAEVQQMKLDIFNRLDSGKFISDPKRIVLSAPEIIIGNVDKSGDLKGGGRLVLRGSDIGLDGVGEAGTITSRAAVIRQTAVDPGIDGAEEVVYPHSAIISQARSLTLQSNDAKDAFSQTPAVAPGSGILIHADHTLDIEASVSADNRKKAVGARVDALKKSKDDLKKHSANQMKRIESFMSQLKKLIDSNEKMTEGCVETRTNLADIDNVQDQIQSLLPSLYRETVDYIHTISQLAEASRQIKAFEAEKSAIKTGDDFKKNTTGASISMKGERISLATVDADNNFRTNPEAGVTVRTPRMGVSMKNDDGTLLENSAFGVASEQIHFSTGQSKKDGSALTAQGRFHVSSQDIRFEAMDYEAKNKKLTEKGLSADGKVVMTAKTIEVSTATPSNLERDGKGKLTKGEYKSEGDVIIRSKTMAFETLDYEVADGKLKTKTLTKGSSIAMRSEKMSMLAADAEGKATGSVSINAKAVSVKSMDVDKEKLSDKSLAAGSTMLLLSEKMYLGAKDKSNKSKKLQGVSDEIGLFADKTFEAQQGDGKAAVQLSGGNLAEGGSKTQIFGATTVDGKTEVKGDLKVPKATIDNLEAKTSLKSPNISDGFAVGAPAAAGSLSTKLKTEDAPKE